MSLRLALTGGGDHQSFGIPCDTPDKDKVGIEFLDDYARSQWEAILYFVVGAAGSGTGSAKDISNGTKTLLRVGEYVNIHGRGANITRDGFTFLLQEVNDQVWSLLVVYLKYIEEVRFVTNLGLLNLTGQSLTWIMMKSSPFSSL